MQGIFRYALAILVAVGHLWPGVWSVKYAHPGVYAVFAFYLLSGYLMALTLTRTYAFDVGGTARFFGNRALRIYPPYLCVVVASVPLLAHVSAGALNPFLGNPHGLLGWLQNFWLFGLAHEKRRIVPPAWSLDVELTFYVVMGLGLGRHRLVSALWCAASIVYTVVLVASGASWTLRYAPVLAASLPFSLGAVAYYWGDPLRHRLRRLGNAWLGPAALLLGTAFVANAIVADEIWADPMLAGFYTSLAIAVLLLFALGSLDVGALPTRLVTFDRWLGNLSYPIFLCHWLAAVATAWLFIGVRRPVGGALFLAALPAIHAIALVLWLGIERPVEALRTVVRQGLPSGGPFRTEAARDPTTPSSAGS